MSETITFTIDGKEITGTPGQTILQAADAAGIYIPRLCAHRDLVPYGACRVCTVIVNGRAQAACTQPIAPGLLVESAGDKLLQLRRNLVEMLLVEGNHFCMFCERSGGCELQATAYRLGILAPRYRHQFPVRGVDASHPDIYLDGNRCIRCGRCVRASRDGDGKNVFQFVGRGQHRRLRVNARAGLGDSDLSRTDQAAEVCPVGAIIKKGVGFQVPVGRRRYDHQPIGSDIEAGTV